MGNKIFDIVKVDKPKKNVFDLTHDVKLSLNMGELVPICCVETVPGDKFSISCESLLRFAPLVSPVMHRMDVTMHYFFVPNRIVHFEWEKFIGNNQTELGTNATLPFVTITNATHTPLCDYLGLPKPAVGKDYEVSALPFLAYQTIYNEFYRDQNLIDPVGNSDFAGMFNNPAMLPGGQYTLTGNAAFMAEIRRRAWEHDYFTSALPNPQKGATLDVPIGDVSLKEDWHTGAGPYPRMETDSGALPNGALGQDTSGGGVNAHITAASTGAGNELAYNPNGSLEVSGTTITDLRRAFKLQEWLERMARGGQRYAEIINNFFGVKSADARLQRPEYITGTKSPVVISEIVNTTGTVDAPQGNMSGHAISVTNGQYGSYFCQEHGYIIGIMSVMPKTAYQQGIPRHFNKQTAFDYFWPQFAHIGEQAILNKELYVNAANQDGTFGYIPRYAEYKYESNRVAGDFRESLDFWHMGRVFATEPALNQTFIECNPDDRIFAVVDPTEHKLYAHVVNQIKAVRPMPKFGTPSF